MEDWIEYIVDKVHEYYAERKIVLWGKYDVSEVIRRRLKEKYGLEVAFYVDNALSKIDNKYVFSVDCLSGQSEKYYIVIPLAFYQSVKEKLLGEGYKPNCDYYYFCDCILRQEPDYYEDMNGNKIIGKYQGLKFAFSGFGSVIEIGDNVRIHETVFYVHSKSKISIGNNAQLFDSRILTHSFSQILIGDDSVLTENSIVLESSAHLEIKYGGNFAYLSMRLGKCARAVFHEEVKSLADKCQKALWTMKRSSSLEVGGGGSFYSSGSFLILDDESTLVIGQKVSIGSFYHIWLGECSKVTIGKECLFSQNLIMRSNDGHSIFDVETGRNINSTPEINKLKKIIIGNHVWVGIHCTVLYDTKIEDGSVIGSMSLVKGKIPNNCIVAGIPAKVIRKNIAWCHEHGADNIEKCGLEFIHLTNEGDIIDEKNNNTYTTYYDASDGET